MAVVTRSVLQSLIPCTGGFSCSAPLYSRCLATTTGPPCIAAAPLRSPRQKRQSTRDTAHEPRGGLEKSEDRQAWISLKRRGRIYPCVYDPRTLLRVLLTIHPSILIHIYPPSPPRLLLSFLKQQRQDGLLVLCPLIVLSSLYSLFLPSFFHSPLRSTPTPVTSAPSTSTSSTLTPSREIS